MTERIIELLHTGNTTLVIENRGTHTFTGRGVADLYSILTERPELLEGAAVADKVVGKGAAALMILGKTGSLYAETISKPALELLAGKGINVEYGTEVPMIWNRSRTGRCPVETLCLDAASAEECLPLIRKFIESIK